MVKVLTYFGMTLAAFAFWQSMDKVHVWIALHQDEKVSFLFLSLPLSLSLSIRAHTEIWHLLATFPVSISSILSNGKPNSNPRLSNLYDYPQEWSYYLGYKKWVFCFDSHTEEPSASIWIAFSLMLILMMTERHGVLVFVQWASCSSLSANFSY